MQCDMFEYFFDKMDQIRGYQTEREYWHDMYRVFDFMLLCAVIGKTTDEDADCHMEHNRVLSLLIGEDKGHFQIQDFQKNQIQNFFRKAKEHVRCRKKKTTDGTIFRMPYLKKCMNLNEWEYFLLFAAFAPNYDIKYGMIFAYLQGDEKKRNPSLWMLVALYQLQATLSEEILSETLQRKGYLCECCLHIVEIQEKNPMDRTISLQERICAFLYGRNEISEDLMTLVEIFQFMDPVDELVIRKDYKDELQGVLQNMFSTNEKNAKILQLYGVQGIGKHFLLKQIAKEWQTNLLFVDVRKLLFLPLKEQQILLSKILLESLLTGSIVCWEDCGYSEQEGIQQQGVKMPEREFLLKRIQDSYRVSVWISEEKADFLLRKNFHVLYMEFPMLQVREREQLWQSKKKRYAISDTVDIQSIANQYILTPQSMQEVLWDARMHASGEIMSEHIREAVSCQVNNQLGESAARIQSVYTWDDLVVDKMQKRQMEMICNQVRYRSVVGEEWGFYQKTSYGRGICAMFYGAPGTGKTMAVQVMANELGLELYRIDLSQIVSKYIGETQKNITELFKRAKNMNALLFFDEADSLFAKRSEVKDSHDRNANAETAHLLQKLEDYEGITILATNYINNIDEAFKRRIKFMVNFAFPTPDVRLKLWKTILPKETPREEELDFAYFAQEFELSGSSIKEILTNAAFCAAAEGRGLCNRDLVLAIKQNFAKYGKVLTDDDFGYLA